MVGNYGLKVNKEKCSKVDTLTMDELIFAGIPLNSKGRTDRVAEITDKYKAELNNLINMRLTLHQKLTLFRVCANHE